MGIYYLLSQDPLPNTVDFLLTSAVLDTRPIDTWVFNIHKQSANLVQPLSMEHEGYFSQSTETYPG